MIESRHAERDEGGRSRVPASVRPRLRVPRRVLHAFRGDARGSTAIEYALIGGLIFAVAAGGMRVYGARTAAVYDRVGTAMTQIN